MNRIKEIKIREIERDLDLLYRRYRALRQQIRTEMDEGKKVLLEESLRDLEGEIGEKERELASLQNRWEDYLHMINFDRAEALAGPVIQRLRQSDFAALFLMQDSQYRMGHYCAKRLREWLLAVSNKIRDISIDPEATGGCIDEGTILRCLASLELDRRGDSKHPDVETAITSLCGSVTGGIIFITLSFNDNLEYRPKLLSWLLKSLWSKLVEHLDALRQRGMRVRVVLTIIALQKLKPDLLDQSLFCTGENFDQHRIVELPLEMWDKEAIRNWLVDHSTLGLNEREAIMLAEEICADCLNGLPYDIDTRLRQKLNQMILRQKELDG